MQEYFKKSHPGIFVLWIFACGDDHVDLPHRAYILMEQILLYSARSLDADTMSSIARWQRISRISLAPDRVVCNMDSFCVHFIAHFNFFIKEGDLLKKFTSCIKSVYLTNCVVFKLKYIKLAFLEISVNKKIE